MNKQRVDVKLQDCKDWWKKQNCLNELNGNKQQMKLFTSTEFSTTGNKDQIRKT